MNKPIARIDRSASLLEVAPRLRLITVPGARVLEFRSPEIVIGRHSSADVRIVHREVSRFHCRLYRADEKWHAEDMGSLNGTQLNGEPFKHTILRHNDVLRIGETLLQVDLGTGEERGSQCQFMVLPSLEAPPSSADKAA